MRALLFLLMVIACLCVHAALARGQVGGGNGRFAHAAGR